MSLSGSFEVVISFKTSGGAPFSVDGMYLSVKLASLERCRMGSTTCYASKLASTISRPYRVTEAVILACSWYRFWSASFFGQP